MKPVSRRACLKTIATVGAVGAASAVLAAAQRSPAASAAKPPIVLHCDLIVDAAKEQEMVRHFHTVFQPAAAKFEGYIDVKILKLRTTIQGTAPARVNYRFQLTYTTEELRQIWVKSAVHTQVWAGIEKTMLNPKDFPVLLFDAV